MYDFYTVFSWLLKVLWRFKLHLCHDDTMLPEDVAQSLPPLPNGKTVVNVLGDFLRYVYGYTRDYISARTTPGRSILWENIANKIEFVLSHPNGWRGQAQAQMREAMVYGGLVYNMEGAFRRVHFVTEGEANLHYSLYHGMVRHRYARDFGAI